ncbi:MAG: glutamine amidotransferase-related protein [Planctomycetota bacterium]|jgi:GMP synthase (glutamine-hydrolysing)
MPREMIAILDFGRLIARRVREHNVYSRIFPTDITAKELSKLSVKGVILSGGPASVRDEGAPRCDEKIFELGVPMLGICYGMQLGCQILGAEIIAAEKREYGRAKLEIIGKSDLFANMPDTTTVWASHGDQVGQLGSDFVKLATTATCPFAAVNSSIRRLRIHRRARLFSGISFMIFAAAAATGR